MKNKETHVLVIDADGTYISYVDDDKDKLQGFADELWKGFPYSLTTINLTTKEDENS